MKLVFTFEKYGTQKEYSINEIRQRSIYKYNEEIQKLLKEEFNAATKEAEDYFLNCGGFLNKQPLQIFTLKNNLRYPCKLDCYADFAAIYEF